MPDPLARDEYRQLYMQFDLAHLERGRVAMTHEIVDEAAILAHLAGATAVGDSGRLDDGPVIAHIVDHPHESVIEHRQRCVEDILQRRYRCTPGGMRRASELGDLLVLLLS